MYTARWPTSVWHSCFRLIGYQTWASMTLWPQKLPLTSTANQRLCAFPSVAQLPCLTVPAVICHDGCLHARHVIAESWRGARVVLTQIAFFGDVHSKEASGVLHSGMAHAQEEDVLQPAQKKARLADKLAKAGGQAPHSRRKLKAVGPKTRCDFMLSDATKCHTFVEVKSVTLSEQRAQCRAVKRAKHLLWCIASASALMFTRCMSGCHSSACMPLL